MADARAQLTDINSSLADLRFAEVVRVPIGTSLGEVARRLREANVSSAVVGDSPAPSTIVTERDLTKALAEGKSSADPVESVATRTPLWATVTSRVEDAADIMLHHEIRHLIVIGPEGRPVGVLSMRDVFSVLLDQARRSS